MYAIKKESYGYRLTFSDFIKLEEMAKWVEESSSVLASAPSKFGVFVDMRGLKPLPQESKTEMEKGQKLFKQKGLERSVVIVDNDLLKMQFQKIAKDSGIYQWERYIATSSTPDWEAVGLEWIKHAKDPDK